jgi:hypothetical protein
VTPRFSGWLVLALLAIARRLMPPRDVRWHDAMRAEITYLPAREAVRWAAGCLSAAIQARFTVMQTGDFKISRLVMAVETIGCFGFLTLGWFEITFGASGVVHQSLDAIERNYLPYPGGAYIVGMLFAGAIIGLIGPIGLMLGARYVLAGRALASRALAWACIGALLGYMVLGGIAGRIYGPPDFQPSFEMALLLSLLPIAGIAHLHWLSRSGTRPHPALAA